ncbi:hypothetical protein ABZ404_37130 [Streptomyces sp. NPDC005878]|uniref:DUF3846 domain-containing protein n=1 Tax=Streptomyces sp. NPDC005878 TaxID=3157077 RepID=UPI0033C2EA9D
MTPTPLHGVRVDPDGTITDITIPDALHMREHLMTLLGGYIEYGHYGSRESAVTAVVHETSAIDGHPRNDPATRYIAALRDAMPGYWLHGPVVFLGYQVRADIVTDLTPEQHAQLHAQLHALDPHQPATSAKGGAFDGH